jgi:XRE family transcriptional regulator, regulator of sulfur utilization
METENRMFQNLAGTRIRAIRAKRGLTQQQLADLAEIPRATLATIEKDDSNPSLAVVYKISVALGVVLDDLIICNEKRVQKIEASEMVIQETSDGTYRAVHVSPQSNHHFTQMVFSLQGNSSYHGKPHPPGSDEYFYVLEGDILLTVGSEEINLTKGESAYFGANVNHRYTNPGSTKAVCIVSIVEKC